jgi:hypothetical protein
MKSTKMKIIQVLSNGSLNFSYRKPSKFKQLLFYEKDYLNSFFSNKKKVKTTAKSNYSLEFRKKFI